MVNKRFDDVGIREEEDVVNEIKDGGADIDACGPRAVARKLLCDDRCEALDGGRGAGRRAGRRQGAGGQHPLFGLSWEAAQCCFSCTAHVLQR